MFVIIDIVTDFVCVLDGYVAMGGKLAVLWQPFKVVIIVGAAIGAVIIGNPKSVIGKLGRGFVKAAKSPAYKKEDYIELLSVQYQIFKMARSKGMLTLESYIENPDESDLFNQFPSFHNNHHAVEFVCDYLRMMSLGSETAHEMEALMDEEIETHHHENHRVTAAIQTMADALPALGIVAAVLGKLIGGALVGTFLGVFVAYGMVGPIAQVLGTVHEAETKYYQCMKSGILAYLNGYAPAVYVEFARKALESDVRPTFYEVEEATSALPAIG